ncbi:MAG: hypothetical protein HYX63_01665 [Gammaproteobacteria bacterium]|nr:hypothetical protein [Gammaproteobacteria bacterium]
MAKSNVNPKPKTGTHEVPTTSKVEANQNLIDMAQSTIEVLSWCESLFSQITQKAARLGGNTSNIKSLAEVGSYLAATFGNDLDVARGDCQVVQS